MGKPSFNNPGRSILRLVAPALRAGVAAFAFVFRCTLAAHAGTPSAATPLILPSAIVFDAAGNLYVAETGNHVIRKIDTSGTTTTIAGTGTQGFAGDGGPATAALLDSPAGIAVDSAGNLYVADTHNQRIRRLTAATGVITTIAGTGIGGFSGDGGAATAAALDLPTALALDDSGNLFVADTNNHRIRRVDGSTGVISTVAGNGTEAFAGDGGPATSASIDSPAGIAVDSGGNLYLADTHNGRIREVVAGTGIISTLAGTGAFGFAGDSGSATSAALAWPRGITVDSSGNVFLADTNNHRIRRISAAGIMTTIAGQGTQTFAGDEAPAVAASLDSPRAVTLSPGGLVTLADTANQRVRQIDALPAPGPDIHTYAGLSLGASTTTLALAGPSAIVYGSGSMTATVTSATSATGSVTFLDSAAGVTTTTLATVALSGNTATVSTASLAAVSHILTASYAGDATHAAATAAAIPITVSPLAVVATPDPASILYGQAIPLLTGTIVGLLPQDGGKVSGVFSTTAATLSPAGAYPITASLTGAAAANYTVNAAAATLSIAKAPASITVMPSATATDLGLPVTFTIRAASTTSGTPTGSVTLLDGSSAVATLSLSPAGTASYTSTLSLGVHPMTAAFPGDSNFLPGTSAISTVGIGIPSDFTLTPTGPVSQSIPSGSSVSYTFAAVYQGNALSSPINLTAQGVPAGATASLNPVYLPPGGTVTSFTLTIQTPKASLRPARDIFPQAPLANQTFQYQNSLAILLFPTIVLRWRRRLNPSDGTLILRRTRFRLTSAISGAFLLLLCLACCTGCGDRVNTASATASNGTSYSITVVGTAASSSGSLLQHSANVILQVL